MDILAYGTLAAWCIALSLSDIRNRRLPDLLTGPGAAGVLGYAACTGRLTAALLGTVLLTAAYLAVHLVRPAAFGAGDVKLAVGLGAATGMAGGQAWVWAALAAPALTAVMGTAGLMASAPIGSWAGSLRRRMPARRSGPATHRIRASSTRAGARPVTVPHGPSMCVATLLAVAFG